MSSSTYARTRVSSTSRHSTQLACTAQRTVVVGYSGHYTRQAAMLLVESFGGRDPVAHIGAYGRLAWIYVGRDQLKSGGA